MKDAPLREGIILIAVLLLLIIPLRSVTKTKPHVVEVREESASETEAYVPVDVLVYAAHDWEWVELRRGEEILGRLEGPTHEGELECPLSLEGEVLVVAIKFLGEERTALGVEFWPEGHREQIKTFWGQGEIVEEVELHWHE